MSGDKEHIEIKGIEALVASGESETLEFKKSTAQLKPACETICAFLNGNGGQVIIGVSPNGKLSGLEVSDKTRCDIADALAKIEPDPAVFQTEIPLKGRLSLIALKVHPKKGQKPYLFDGRPFQRRGPTTSRMSSDTYNRLLLRRPENQSLWESRVAESFAIEHLDTTEIERVGRLAQAKGSIPGDVVLDVREVLRGFEVLGDNGELLNSAVALFGASNSPRRSMHQCSLQLACFEGIEKSVFIDQREVAGGAFYLLGEAENFIRRHMPVSARIVEGEMERREVPLIPWEALREALMNALIHRDYSNVSGSIDLAIYADRLEIWSIGELPEGLRIDQLKKQHKSVRRNPNIAAAFRHCGLIEKWGRGTQILVRRCVSAGLPEPDFLEEQGFFAVIFSAPFAPLALIGDVDLSALEKELFNLISPTDKTPVRVLTLATDGVSRRSVQRALKSLVDLGLIAKVGGGHALGYRRATRG